MTDPYKTQRETCKVFQETGKHTTVKGHNVCCADDNVHVHHPVQPKTQVEKWREEIEENGKVLDLCGCTDYGLACEFCTPRYKKLDELYSLIAKDHEKNKHYLNRHPTGTFADDKCNCAEITCKVGCKRNHTHKTFSCEKCNPKVTLLDKIKKLLQ